MTPDQIDAMTPDQMREALTRVVGLCHSYTPVPPPLFRGPGLSEHGVGFNHGTSTLARAVLDMIAGEPGDDE